MSSFKSSKSAFYNYLVQCSDAYYNTGSPLISDSEFDKLVDEFQTLYKSPFTYIGAAETTHQKVTLPFYTSSLTKCKDTTSLSRFANSAPGVHQYVFSEKLDGVSLVVHYRPEQAIQLYTRGDGTTGKNVSHLAPYLRLPSLSKRQEELLVRGEVMIPKTFASKCGDNLRNIVSGVITAKTPNKEICELLQFVAHGIQNIALKPSDAMKYCEKLGFSIPVFKVINKADLDTCNSVLTNLEEKSLYQIDGCVVAKDIYIAITDDKPKHIIAFKRMGLTKTTTVKGIKWDQSRYGTLHPTVEIEPVQLDGCTISNCSGFHAKYIFENCINVGTVIEVQRSGGVIPDIVGVITSSKTPGMPLGDWTWDGVHIRSVEPSEEMNIERLVYSMKTLEAKGISDGVVRKLYAVGFCSELDLWAAKANDFTAAEGIKEKSASNIYQSLQIAKSNLNVVNCLRISALFPNFHEKLKTIAAKIDVCKYIKDRHISDNQLLQTLHSMSIITQASAFIDGCEAFRSNKLFMQMLEIAIANTVTAPKEEEKMPEVSLRVVFTGFRDKNLLEDCKKRGIEVQDSITKATNMLVVADLESGSTKVEKARKQGCKIVSKEEFTKLVFK
jgi:DNA ligase (NAD+)